MRCPGGDEPTCVRRDAARDRGQRQAGGAGLEHPPPPEAVAERATSEGQRSQEHRVGTRHPLHLGDRRAVRFLDRGQRHVDDRGHHERDARPEDRGQEDPAPGVRRASGSLRRRAHDGGVAGGPLGDDHPPKSPSGSITETVFVERVRSGKPGRLDKGNGRGNV